MYIEVGRISIKVHTADVISSRWLVAPRCSPHLDTISLSGFQSNVLPPVTSDTLFLLKPNFDMKS
jgi:hypothetical protein